MKSAAITLSLAMSAPLVFLIPLEASARNLSNPQTYERCIRDSMKGVTSNRAAEEATRACREQSAGDRVNDADLPPDALDKLEIHAGFGWGIFSGSLYNGNSGYAITQVIVLITPMTKGNVAAASADGTEYGIALAVQPLTKGALSMPIPSDNTLEYSWKIVKARGYKTR
ncbi:hypothetical protein [Nitrosovibrio tenuis]|uniref:Uncharacterized protein n=1 Tax=Nitrosovibrio tenuis TaxID=1233 RepID=A0A1H7LCZ9_9PROT|nr:hypothetical protein [Nitrosovibrio tenuis]SEK96832.1 hypothetical protein SAMN05216387_10425 [Nitrosovibrio tenuis]